MNKTKIYEDLVISRKTCVQCKGLKNPAAVESGMFDSEQIGPWSIWQGNLNAQLLVVGQDWGDVLYFFKWQGRDQPSKNPTNENLQELLKGIGIEIGKPRDPQNQILFLTNLILCLKTGGLQADIEDQWFKNCSEKFFKPLIDIINPKVIIALGKKVSESILNLYGMSYPKNCSYSKLLIQSPYQIRESTVLFPVYHCGAGSINRNRSLSEQKEDWSLISNWLINNYSY